MELIPKSDQAEFLIYSFRYTLGRQTYAVNTVQRVIKASWANLSDGNKFLIQREIREAQTREQLGSPYDAIGWTEIMVLQ